MLKRALLVVVIATIHLLSFAQKDNHYKIEIKLKNNKDTVLYMANYYGDKTYLTDTAYNEKGKGLFVFSKDEELGGGLYIIVSQEKKSLFEFLVADSRDMKFETSNEDFVSHMKVHNSPENKTFYEYLKFSAGLYDKVKPLNADLKRLGPDADSSVIINKEIKELNKEMVAYKENLIEENPSSFLSSFFKLLKDPAVPDTLLTLPDGTKDSAYPYKYYKEHFWDNVNLTDDRLIRTPVFYKKLDTYFDKVIVKDADTIINEIDKLLSKMNEKGELYKFSLWHLTIKFDESQIMGHDAILVYLSDNYFSKGKADWLNEGVIKNIKEEADKRRNTLIGQQAPNLIMQDTNFKPVSLYDLKNEFVLMFFWDPGCGHCKEETPHLVDFYNKYSKEFDLEVYAVCADTNMVKMKDYITKRNMNFINVDGPRAYTTDYHDLYNIFSTPVLILLDKNKKIIAKRLLSEQLPDFIKNYKEYELKND